MRLIRTLFAGVLLMFATAIPTLAAEKAIIVLDASGSMWAQIDGVARITIARQTLAKIRSTTYLVTSIFLLVIQI